MQYEQSNSQVIPWNTNKEWWSDNLMSWWKSNEKVMI